MQQRSRDVLPLSGKVNVLNKERKKSHVGLSGTYGKDEPPVCGTVRKEQEIRAGFAVTPHIAKRTAAVAEKCLVILRLRPSHRQKKVTSHHHQEGVHRAVRPQTRELYHRIWS